MIKLSQLGRLRSKSQALRPSRPRAALRRCGHERVSGPVMSRTRRSHVTLGRGEQIQRLEVSTWSRFSTFAALFICASPIVAQAFSVGFNDPYFGGSVNPSATQTTLQLSVPDSLPGEVNRATFGWSASPCPAAVKIKFFRLWGRINVFHPLYTFLTERGPFDVTQPIQTSPLYPPATQTVELIPPVALQAGDVIAITNLTTCGGPTYVANLPGGLPPWGNSSLTVLGDATGDIYDGPPGGPVFVTASGTTHVLPLLGGRFQVTMFAMDPRTGATTI